MQLEAGQHFRVLINWERLKKLCRRAGGEGFLLIRQLGFNFKTRNLISQKLGNIYFLGNYTNRPGNHRVVGKLGGAR